MTTEKTENYEVVPYHVNSTITIDVTKIEKDYWLTVQQIAKMYDVDRSVIQKHIQNIYNEKELDKNSTCAFFAQVRDEGGRKVSRNVPHYNIDMVIAIGYRVKSDRGIIFRQWTTGIIIKEIIGEAEQTYIQPLPNYSEFEIFNFFANYIYLPIKTISQITKTSARSFQIKCRTGKLESRYVHIKGNSNRCYEIAVSSLDIDTKNKIFEYLKIQNQLSLLINTAKNIQQMLLTGNGEYMSNAKMLLSNELILKNGKGRSYVK